MKEVTRSRWSRWVRSLFGRPTAPIQHPCLRVEPLEDRAVPAVSGVVFQDFNANGTRDTTGTLANSAGGTIRTAIDRGLGGVTVTAYNAAGTAVATTATASDGTYTLTGLTAGTQYRVEFTGLPTGYSFGPHGADSGSGVQFVSGAATNVSAGLVRPTDFSTDNPTVVANRFLYGDQLSGDFNSEAVIQAFPYTAGGTTNNNSSPTPTTVATAADVGAVFGLAADRAGTVYAAAYTKLHSGYGPTAGGFSGNGSIYRITSDGAGGYNTPTLLVNLNQLFSGAVAGTDFRSGYAGGDAEYEDDGISSSTTYSATGTWDAVGKTALGGMAVSDDGNTLFVMNLANRRLYRIPLDAGPITTANVTSADIPFNAPGATGTNGGTQAGDLRPFAVTYHNGQVYVGIVNSAESTGLRSDLHAYVYQVNPTTLAFGGSPVFTETDMTYTRLNPVGGNGDGRWHAWSPVYANVYGDTSGALAYGQPMLSGISFDADDNMTLAFRDRVGDQGGQSGNGDSTGPGTDTGSATYVPADFNNPGRVYQTFPVGEMQRAFKNAGSGWTLESNGRGPGGTPSGQRVGTGDGPGGGQFYNQVYGNISHGYVSTGGVSQVPGFPDVLNTNYDPFVGGDYRSGGVRWGANDTGAISKGYFLYARDDAGTFGKANGMGNITHVPDTAPIEIGNRLFLDRNADGKQDADELGISGVRVVLIDPATSTTVGTATTAADGSYYFSNDTRRTSGGNAVYSSLIVPTHTYQVRIDRTQTGVAGYGISPQLNDATANGTARDSNSTAGAGNTAVISATTGADGVSDHTFDAGFVPGRIGDTVFLDLNNNGLPDSGEALGGVKVRLTADVDGTGTTSTFTATTDAAGFYQFSDLRLTTPAGSTITYRVTVDTATLPVGAVQTVDPDATLDDTSTTQLTVAANSDQTLDFGYRGNASLGDRVWYDADGDGVQDAGEPGIAGVVLTATWAGRDGDLGTAGDNATFTATTNATGNYSFTGLPANTLVGVTPNYRVRVVAPPARYPTLTDSLNDGILSATNPADVQVSPTTGNPLNARTDVDFGYRGTAQLGNLVWHDLNANGRQDGGTEVGINGVPVELYFDANNNGTFEPGELATPLLAATTAGGGAYAFTNLAAGNYRVRFGDSDGTVTFTRTTADAGTANDATDSDANVGTGFTGDYALALGASDQSVDAGLYRLTAIGDTVWYDTNGNGTQQAGESGLSGVELVLDYAGLDGVFGNGDDVTAQATATTDGSGNYSFPSLRPGTYRVQVRDVTVPLSPFAYTTTGGNTQSSSPTSNTPDLARDFGVRGTGTVGDTVFFDVNNNGAPDAGEAISGVVVRLSGDLDGDGAVEGGETLTATTNAAGFYQFTNLRTTSGGVPYAVTVDTSTLPPNVTQTVDPDGVLNDASTSTRTTAAPDDPTRDFGYRGPGVIGDTVWLDVNGNGTFEAGEGLNGVRVTLTGDFNGDGTTETQTATTASDGQYTFTGLRTTTGGVPYTVTVVAASLPPSLTQTVDPDATLDNTATATLTTAANSNLTRDFAYRGPGTIGDTVWLDVNANNTFDSGEGIGGVQLTLTGDFNGDGTTETQTATTDTNGQYLFSGLRVSAGGVPYTVRVVAATLPTGVTQTFDPDATLDGTATASLTTAITSNLTRDFAYRGTGSIGDRVFNDINNNGQWDSGEGINGVRVTLSGDLDNDGTPETVTATTSGDGFYLFSGLVVNADIFGEGEIPKTYTVTVVSATLPPVMAQTVDPDGTLDNVSDATLSPSAPTDLTRDFGYRAGGSVGDTVFLDVNNDGLPSSGEGIAGVRVRLVGDFDGDGTTETVSATTDTNGFYQFTGLRTTAGGVTYTVNVDTSTLPAGVTQTVDPDGTLNDASTSTRTTAAPNDPTRDFGYRGPGSVGDTVFIDANNDGLPNAGEGLAGVRLLLTGDLDGDGTPETVTATTNASGVYSFTGLRTTAPGVTYSVAVDASTLPLNVTQTVDPDGTPDNASTSTRTTAAPNDPTRDFGYRGNASLGDRVWYDADGDGVQDAGEPGIAGVTLTATWVGPNGAFGGGDDVTFTVTTAADGGYLFTGLPANALSGLTPNYRVQVATPPARYPTFTDSLDNGGAANPVNPLDVPVSPTAADPLNARRDVDFGYRGTAALGDTVWHDRNGNGRQDGGTEAGIDGVPVELYFDANNNGTFEAGELATPLLAATTAAGGTYSFPNLAAGNYRVRFGVPSGFARTGADSPVAADATDSDANVGTGFTGDYALTNGQTDPTVDAGVYQPVTIGDTVWYDTNGNGTQDPAEATLGIPGVVLVLDYAGPDGAFDGTGDVTGQATATTNASGFYSFTNLRPGTYRVRVQDASVPVPSLEYTTAGGNTQGSVTTSGVNDPNRDFGVRGSGTIGDTIFLDVNASGTPDAGEALQGVVVRLAGDLDNDGTVEANETLTATTNASGQYLFTGLRTSAAGVPYTVTVDPTTLPQTGSGTPVTNTVDPNGGNDNTSTASLTDGSPNDLLQDFGYRGPGTIGDTVFLDVNNSGTADPGEGITGVRVTLTADVDGNGVTETFTATTDASGMYRFDNLPVRNPAGTLITYTVAVNSADLPAGVTNTTDPDGGNNSTSSLTLNPANPVNLAQDFGYQGDGSIGDTVFLDLNNNGVADPGEGITGATVVLTADVNGDGVQDLTVTATTGADGEYLFDNLPVNFGGRTLTPITYTVRVTGGLPTGVSNTVDPDGTTDSTWAGTLATGPAAPDRRDIDFGYRGTGRLGDRVWVDVNGDGVQDATSSEPSLPNVGFTLTYAGENGTFGDADDITTTATAGTNGLYTFDGLPAGNFRVTVNTATLPGNVTQTFDLDGTGTPHAAVATLTTGQTRTDADFGYRGAAGLGDRVWLDQNRNGAQDPGEGGIPGAVVQLVLAGPDGLMSTADDLTFTATTGTNGIYTFGGLPVYGPTSDFRVTLTSLPTTGLDAVGDLDSPAGSGDQTVFGGLLANQTRTDVDFGYAGRGRIAGTVFEDVNNDGVRQSGEPAIPGTVLVLEGTDVFGNPVRDPLTGGPLTATADANGDYAFTSLPPGTYSVREVQPGGYLDGTDTVGSLGGVLGADRVSRIVMPADGNSVQNNFAELRPARVAGTVYEDRNNNGRQDPSEPGIPGVRVVLSGTDDRGPVALTLTTDANGNYAFPDLRPGTYTLTQTQPPLFNQGQNTPGTSGGSLGATDVIQSIVLAPGANAVEYRFGERVRQASDTPTLAVEPVQPWEVSKRMFLSSTSAARTASVPDFAALGSVNTTRPTQFVATGDDAGGSRVRVYDLTSGRERFRFEPFGGFMGGVRTAVGDLTGDGIPDVVAAAGPGGGPHVIIYNGDTGAVVQSFFAFEAAFRGGSFVATGDFDGDGTADLAVSADRGGGPRVRVFRSGNPGWVMSDFWGIEDVNFRGGARVAAGDVNHDGRTDLVVSAGFGGGPRIAVYDGNGIPTNKQNKFVGDFFAFEPTFSGGVYVTVGDVDGDGYADVIAGAGEGGGPRVRTISGRELTAGRVTTVTDQFVFDLNGNAGGARVAATDLDGDGTAELFVGTGPGVRPVARFFNPRTGAPLNTFSPQWENTINGVFVG